VRPIPALPRKRFSNEPPITIFSQYTDYLRTEKPSGEPTMKLRPKKPLPKWPALKIELWEVGMLSPSPVNSRLHTKEDIAAVAASFQQWGVTVPLLIDERGVVISGHCRLAAAKLLKLPELPVVIARGWSEAQKRAYCIADNQLAARATWDSPVLNSEVKFLEGAGFELPLIGFSEENLKSVLAGVFGNRGIADPDAEIEPPARPVSRLGDIWRLGLHLVICGDSTDAKTVAKLLGGFKTGPRVILMVTDPPYGVNYDPGWRQRADKKKSGRSTGKVLNDHRVDWREAWALFPGDVAYVWHAGLFGGEVAESLKACGFDIRSQIVWAKPHFTLGRGDYH